MRAVCPPADCKCLTRRTGRYPDIDAADGERHHIDGQVLRCYTMGYIVTHSQSYDLYEIYEYVHIHSGISRFIVHIQSFI